MIHSKRDNDIEDITIPGRDCVVSQSEHCAWILGALGRVYQRKLFYYSTCASKL